MRTVYVIMTSRGCSDYPHSIFFSRKSALERIKQLEKNSKRHFYFIERAVLGEEP